MPRGSIYAVEFDGTLCESMWPDIGEPNVELINTLKTIRKSGDYVILYTMREGAKLDEALAWCKTQGLIFDAVNDNLPIIRAFFGNNPRKIYADYYIDYHNMRIDNLPFRG